MPTIKITRGYISAETKGRPNTLRALQSFGKSKRKITSSCSRIELKRSNLALRSDGELHVEVKLHFSRPKKFGGKIMGINTFKAAGSSKDDIKFYYADVGDLKLKLKLTWFDDLARGSPEHFTAWCLLFFPL